LDVGLPQAFAATWAPDGSRIAFLGAPDQGLTGVARADAVFNLYLMQPDGSQVHLLLQGLHDMASIAWSPDSRWIVLHASLTPERQDRGLWLVEVATGNYRQIARGDFAAPVWSPDGQRLAVIQHQGEYPNEQQQIVIAGVGTLLHAP
jgi:Tol biopolymer transport system component